MPSHIPTSRLRVHRRQSRQRGRSVSRDWLLTGVSGLAVGMMLFASSSANARALNGGSAGGLSAPNIASDAAAQAAQQAAAAAAQSQQSLARAARALQDIQAVQAAARAAAAAAQVSATAPVAVPNGLAAGGLLPNTPRWGGANTPQNWVGASEPTQSVDGNGQTQVNIRQQAQQAILNWQSFNVGARTTLTFDQMGNSNWVALNRVNNATAPSQILGNIKADGHVYVINPNGIIFGGNSQVNVGSLIAAAADITPDQFAKTGIFSELNGSVYTPNFKATGGKVVVEAGAVIGTRAPSSVTAGGGYVLMIGSEVSNSGAIATPKGQTILAAGDDFVLRRGFSTDANSVSTTRGIEISPQFKDQSSAGRVSNDGLIFAQQGDITLAGRNLLQNGALLATTSVNTRGTIHLLNRASDQEGAITLGAAALTAILPELDSTETALDSQRDGLIAASNAANAARAAVVPGVFDNLSMLADRQDQSRIEVVSGGKVTFKGGSYTAAQGGQIAVSAKSRIITETGATLDVSGIRNVALAMAANNMQVNIQGNELRDSPQNRDGSVLKNENVWIDIRNLTLVPAGTGGYDSDRYYTGGGLLEVGGYLANTAHGIGEWAAVGGTITLASDVVIAQKGAVFDLSGGSLDFSGGYIRSTNLISRDGRRYSIDNAPGDLEFANFAGSFRRSHNIQGQEDKRLTEIWTSIFDRGRNSIRWEDGYTVGRDAGRLNLATPTAVFEADIIADVVQGGRQNGKRPSGVTDGYKATQTIVAQAATLASGNYNYFGRVGVFDTDVKIGDIADITAGLDLAAALPADRNKSLWLDAGRLNGIKLGGLDLATAGKVTIERALTLADGGVLNLIAPNVDLAADVTAHGGRLAVTNVFQTATPNQVPRGLMIDGKSGVTLREGVTLDVGGLWVNAKIDRADNNKAAFIDGGNVSLVSTGDVSTAQGSLIDVSSGAFVGINGKIKGGKGGDVTLAADYYVNAGDVATTSQLGGLTLNGDIIAYGMAGGGKLTISSGPGVVIGGRILRNNGELAAGEIAPIDLVATEDFIVRSGEILPADFHYTRTVAAPGEVLGATPQFSADNLVTLAADWQLPATANAASSYRIVYINPLGSQLTASANFYSQPTIPKGSQIVRFSSNAIQFPTNYIVPGNVFPNGIPIPPSSGVMAAGAVAPSDVVFASGTIIGAGAAVSRNVPVRALLELDASLFRSGFANYDMTGHMGVVVAEQARISVETPVYRQVSAALSLPTGSGRSATFEIWTPPLYLEDPAAGVLDQRIGGDLMLRSEGAIRVGTGAVISVDAGREIALVGNMRGGIKQITVDGTLNAFGGTISIDSLSGTLPNGSAHSHSIWIGDNAVLDVAGRAVTARDRSGRRYGIVQAGGTISIGGDLDWEIEGKSISPDMLAIIRPGAVLDASGTSAIIDVPVSDRFVRGSAAPLFIASDGGSIIVKSNMGLYLDGTLRAAAGGAGAAGGTLAFALEAPLYDANTVTNGVLQPREFVIAQSQGAGKLTAALQPGASDAALKVGTARIGVDRISAGGFGNLSLLSTGLISFDGDVSLQMAQNLRLYSASFALSHAAPTTSRIELAAPYVMLAGATQHLISPDAQRLAVSRNTGVLLNGANAAFRVDADLIDIRDLVGFGLDGTVPQVSGTLAVQRNGFGKIDLVSRGDLRLLQNDGSGVADATFPTGVNQVRTQISASRDLTVTAAQVYPATGVAARIGAVRTLTIQGYGWTPDMPSSAFGSLTLDAETVNQGGIVRAPGGLVTVGVTAKQVNLLPGSVTSVSLAGVSLPYGGTADGLSWIHDGKKVSFDSIAGSRLTGVTLGGASIDVRSGAVIDLQGGGELTGAGFISGRGGSVDVLKYALAAANPALNYSDLGNGVYAIVPGYRSGYAPVSPDAGNGNPVVGRQITVPAGVPGLPAGTYTLLPSTYALMPGAFRIELGAAENPVGAGVRETASGSYLTQAYLGYSGTNIRTSLPNHVIISAADTVRAHAQYNETNYSDFAITRAAHLGWPRPLLPMDGRKLTLAFTSQATLAATPLRFDGTALFAGVKGGNAGYAGVGTDSTSSFGGSTLEILGAGSSKTAGSISIADHALSAIGAPRLLIGATLGAGTATGETSGDGFPGYRLVVGSTVGTVVIRSGAVLSAGEVMLATNMNGSILVEAGATITTLGRGPSSFDSSDGYIFDLFLAPSVLAVSNGMLEFLPSINSSTSGRVDIGGCVGSACSGTTQLYSEQSIALVSNQTVNLGANVSYGTRHLQLGASAVNIGTDETLNALPAGILPLGLSFNQQIFDRLIAGNQGAGIPKLESLTLTARNSINVFGTVDLSTIEPATGRSSLAQLVLNTPAVYGYGSSSDVASLTTDKLVWSGIWNGDATVPFGAGASLLPGAVSPGGAGTGSGVLNFIASEISLGYADRMRPDNQTALERLMLGFGSVNLTASRMIGGNNKGNLTVYQFGPSPDANYNPKTYAGTGGILNLTTPLLSGAAGSTLSITAGGALNVLAPAGADLGTSNSDALGATLNLKGDTITIASAVVLPSGRLSLTAKNDIVLADGSHIDVSGRAVAMFDVTQYSWGGSVAVESTDGGVMQSAGSVIDLSAENNAAGSLSVAALKGNIALAGSIRGAASGSYHAGGGVMLPWLSGGVAIRGGTIADFAGLNARLTAGGIFGERSFQTKQGDLVVGDEIRANLVTISVDGGSLTVNGRIDASGERVGTIRLAARDGLTLGASSMLDAHGTVLRVDSDGDAIDSPNRAIVELTSKAGRVTLQSGATIDLRSADSVARGTLTINARRMSETGGDIDIDAGGNYDIRSARSIAVNGLWTYQPTDADGTIVQDNGGTNPIGADGSVGLDQVHQRSEAFMQAALANGDLRGRLGGLSRYTDAFHLRPGVEIAPATEDGKLTIKNDIDLSRYRYDSVNPHTQKTAIYGSGEPGALVIRAGGDLSIQGSVTDGFAPPPGTPDDNGWASAIVTFPGGMTENAYALPKGATIPKGATFETGSVLDFDATFGRVVIAEAGVPVAQAFTLASDIPIPAGQAVPMYMYVYLGEYLISSPITLGNGVYASAVVNGNYVYYAPGDVLPAGALLQTLDLNSGSIAPVDVVVSAGSYISAGTVFSSTIYGAAPQLRANFAMPAQVTLARSYTLASAVTATGTVVTSTQAFNVGDTIPAGTVLGEGTKLGTGMSLPFAVDVDRVTWPKNVALDFNGGTVTMIADKLLTEAGTLPAWTTGIPSLSLRAGQLWAVAPMLAPGSQSWDIRLGSGADIGAASQQALRMADTLNGGGNLVLSDKHVLAGTQKEIFSVIRTGTGDLDLLAGGKFDQQTLYGIYTAGTQSAALLDGNGANPYGLPRGLTDGKVLGNRYALYDSAVAGSQYQAWYPEHGGNLTINVGGDMTGTIVGAGGGMQRATASSYVGNWLWTQGGAEQGLKTAWWINFGAYSIDSSNTNQPLVVAGFSGIGTLGGGNVAISVGGDAGVIESRGSQDAPRSQGLNIAIGSTGRRLDDGSVLKTGGGDLTLDIAGAMNPLHPRLNRSSINGNNAQSVTPMANDLNGVVANLRGLVDIGAGAIGRVDLAYGRTGTGDPRGPDLFTANLGLSSGGFTMLSGDNIATVAARGDLVIGQTVDPGTITNRMNTSPYTSGGQSFDGGGRTMFSLYTDETTLSAFSAGGNLTPFKQSTAGFGSSSASGPANHNLYTNAFPNLGFSALSGSIYIDGSTTLFPTSRGQLDLLAAQSIYGAGGSIHIGGGDVAGTVGTIARPRFSLSTNFADATAFKSVTSNLHAGDPLPARFYAVGGDIVEFRSGDQTVVTPSGSAPMTISIAAKPLWLRAGRDLVNVSGLALNNDVDDVSILWAGRDVLYAKMMVAGPGLLDVGAGRNIYLADQGQLVSLGAIAVGDTRPGASILVQAGTGVAAPDYATLAARYLDHANLAVTGTPLADQPGKVAKTYEKELADWLAQRFGFNGTAEQARAYFAGLDADQRGIFLRQVYFAELTAAGREYNDPQSSRYQNYIRGREAIATLFPDKDASGNAIARSGDITLFSTESYSTANPPVRTTRDGSVRTLFGGDIQMLAPGGRVIVGVEGVVPGANAGLLTQGGGDIQIYSQGSLLLGLSRIMTVFGDDIIAWSNQGDINAGRGAKTTIGYTPAKRVQDDYGNVIISPNAPTSGAGISARSAIPGIASGDIDLIAPQGTIDIGEAGVSGRNINLVALQIINAANITAQGNVSGVPMVQAPSISAALTTSNATAATQQTAIPGQGSGNERPSVIIVEVLGYGGGEGGEEQKDEGERRSRGQRAQVYDPLGSVQFVGMGQLSEGEKGKLTAEERDRLAAP
ncbi:MAG: filamentous hemagglutinin [Bradyrhizobiaceae bacterium PARB1]|nr:MAG: filamentous hemagglutinin [Bradyrhizobiaceae bacterium PARB1]